MKYAREFITSTVVGGLFIVVPVYLAVLLLLKGMKSVAGLVRPIAALVPDWLPAEGLLSLVLVLALCFLVGVAVRTRTGRAVRERMEKVFFERLPGYGLLRSLTQRLAGDGEEQHLAAGTGGNRGRARSGVHYRRARRRPIHDLRPVGAHAVRRGRVRHRPGTRAHPRHPVHPGHQLHLPLGLRVERPRGGDAGDGSQRTGEPSRHGPVTPSIHGPKEHEMRTRYRQ